MANKQFNSVDGYSVSNALVVIDSTGNVIANNLIANGNSNVANLTANGNITANYFIGNGSQLTGISAAIQVSDEGNILTNAVTSINFTGSGVTATNVDNDVTVNISGGGGSSITTVIETNSSFTASINTRYILANSNPTTMTLPSAPTLGDTVYVVVANDLTTNIVARNGANIMGQAEDLTLNVSDISIGLVYANTTLGWRVV